MSNDRDTSPRGEASQAIADALSEESVAAQAFLHETEAEALAVHMAGSLVGGLAFRAVAGRLDRATKEMLMHQLWGMAEGLDAIERRSLKGLQRDAVGAAAGQFRGYSDWLAKRLDD